MEKPFGTLGYDRSQPWTKIDVGQGTEGKSCSIIIGLHFIIYFILDINLKPEGCRSSVEPSC